MRFYEPDSGEIRINGEDIRDVQGELTPECRYRSIARAFAADPRILLLDEATSNVDTRTEQSIQDAM